MHLPAPASNHSHAKSNQQPTTIPAACALATSVHVAPPPARRSTGAHPRGSGLRHRPAARLPPKTNRQPSRSSDVSARSSASTLRAARVPVPETSWLGDGHSICCVRLMLHRIGSRLGLVSARLVRKQATPWRELLLNARLHADQPAAHDMAWRSTSSRPRPTSAAEPGISASSPGCGAPAHRSSPAPTRPTARRSPRPPPCSCRTLRNISRRCRRNGCRRTAAPPSRTTC